MNASPCYLRHPCPDRCPECHSYCEDYIRWQLQRRIEIDRQRNDKDRERSLNDRNYLRKKRS